MNRELPPASGLYDPSLEHDGCGVGFVARVDGVATHEILKLGLRGAANLAHRGAVSADGSTADGAGVLTQVPRKLLCRELRAAGFSIDEADVAVGMIFFPRSHAPARERGLAIVEEEVHRAGIIQLMWRDVPVDRAALGDQARATEPTARQLLMKRPPGVSDDDFERMLYVCRRRIQKRVAQAGCDPFYLCSFSSRTVVYKGLVATPQLAAYFRDLADADYETSVCVFHQRFSTNTFPTWFLAQPFRMIAHNGEFNTLRGNINWLRARQGSLKSELFGEALADLLPVVNANDSDSATFDRVFELLTMSGRDPLRVLMMMVPEAHQSVVDLSPDVRAMHEYNSTLMEPWDGPAALVFCDGRVAAAALDRNGLRPMRYWITSDGLVVAGSEAGILPLDPAKVVEKGKLAPGGIFAVEMAKDGVGGRVLHSREIKEGVSKSLPFGRWLQENRVRAEAAQIPAELATRNDAVCTPEELVRLQRAFGYGKEDLDRILGPMSADGKPPIGSMGDDTPIAVLSAKPQTLYRSFKQRFAQVTNPPIDSIREETIMSIQSAVGRRGNLLEDAPEAARLIRFPSPLISGAELAWLCKREQDGFPSVVIDAVFERGAGPQAMELALQRVCAEAEAAVDRGASLIVVSDRAVCAEKVAIPMLLAVSAVQQHLIRTGKRLLCSIIADAGDVREDHHLACLLGFGATLIHPRLALATVEALAKSEGREAAAAVKNYRKAAESGILKIMAKMGIAVLHSYRGAQLFEVIGIAKRVIDQYFESTPGRLGGMELVHIAADQIAFHDEGFGAEPAAGDAGLPDRGIYRFRKGAEHHTNAPEVFTALHKAVKTQSREAFDEYARRADAEPAARIRDLLRYKKSDTPVPLDEVEPAAAIVQRFTTQAMSHGSLSREAHELVSVAMNRLGGRSNSGEGGEDPARFKRYTVRELPQLKTRYKSAWLPEEGDWGNSTIKQVSTARFGVTPLYLVAASELEIKMAQGAKPGEGGQIPGFKVSEEIGELRRAAPGTTLISPPPHHDIYSIEDLAQLIYDLKRVNRLARICVKLVSTIGVGTIAAGVAKAYADTIQISGHEGGTGASPLSSIKHSGMPWELGLAETQQVLVKNGLRGRVRLRVDGGLRTGRDVVMAALLGAEEYGFGTSALLAVGCVMARQCHSNTCPVGIATQREDLRAKFPGKPEHLISYMLYIAEQVRMILAEMGCRSLDEIVGRTDLLEERADVTLPRCAGLELSGLFAAPVRYQVGERGDATVALRQTTPANVRPETEMPLDERLLSEAWPVISAGGRFVRTYAIGNCDRTVGARLAGEIARLRGEAGFEAGTIDATFRGTAGQSFGAFCTAGMRLTLRGDAQDYVGKSMHAGTIVIAQPKECPVESHLTTIVGNTVLYGATGGELFIAGRAGERFCVRNSGALAIAEGCGDHGCEYMTGGTVVLLGVFGRNFGAGMSGGEAFVLDLHGHLPELANREMIEMKRVAAGPEAERLRGLIERHASETDSARARAILETWADALPTFWRVTPKAAVAAAPEVVVVKAGTREAAKA
jgi:glutamate synthase domain-containing protein 2/glutamate synthase domain-containing protein 1/glutamate synthase domain-containing protein 3